MGTNTVQGGGRDPPRGAANEDRSLPPAARIPPELLPVFAKVGGGARGGGGDYGSSGEETVEKPRRGEIKTTAGNKTGGGGGTWEPIPSREVDETLLCGAANGDLVKVNSMFALVGGPPSLRALDGLGTC